MTPFNAHLWSFLRAATALLCVSVLCFGTKNKAPAAEQLHAVMIADDQFTPAELKAIRADGSNALVLVLDGRSEADRQRELSVARQIEQSGLDLYYWIEIARCPQLADAHPEWMSSLQGHTEWRRFFPDAPRPRKNVEVIKNYPWVPLQYKESFEAHRGRVQRLLDGMPPSKGIFLNDLQGGPSACGCGNTLCRWTADYGPIKTATPLADNAAARFVKAVAKLAPASEIIPVWLTECEAHDGAKDGLCAGVGCFKGICWRAFTRQLTPVAGESQRIGVLLTYRALQRDLPRYDGKAGWISHALESFQTMPPRRGGVSIAAGRLVAVLQGWDVTEAEIGAQKKRAVEAGAAGYVVARTKIDQSWQPRLYKLPR